MSQINQPTSNRISPKPYSVEETANGFEFITANNSRYEIYIGDGRKYFPGSILAFQSIYFGISRKEKPPKGTELKDERIQETIRWAIETLLDEEPNLIIAFSYSSHKRKPASRKQLFRGWFTEEDDGYVFQDYELEPQSEDGPTTLVGIIARADNPSLGLIPQAVRTFEASKK